jgi:hypothetical protein
MAIGGIGDLRVEVPPQGKEDAPACWRTDPTPAICGIDAVVGLP